MTMIYCQERNGMHEFYMTLDRNEYYLFSQKYRVGVDKFYRKGVQLDKGIKHGIGRTDYAIHQTMDKVKRHIRYIEKEYNLIILDKTKIRAAA